MARPNMVGSAGADRPTGGTPPSRNPRELVDELRAISDTDHPGDPRAQAKANQPAQPSMPGPAPTTQRNMHRVIQRRLQAAEEAAKAAPPAAEAAPKPPPEAPEAAPVVNADVEDAVGRAGSFAAAWASEAEENDLLHVLCFLEERSLPELVQAIVRSYVESRADDDDVKAVLHARGNYRRV